MSDDDVCIWQRVGMVRARLAHSEKNLRNSSNARNGKQLDVGWLSIAA